MATATLRGILVVAAVALGIFVLSKAFPTGSSAPTVPETTAAEPSPEPTGEQTEEPTGPTQPAEECPPPKDFPPIQLLNGTDINGLAGDTQGRLEAEGYDVPAVGDATIQADRTRVTAKNDVENLAECLVESEFPKGQVESAAPDAEFDITVILGRDARRGGGGGGG